MDISAARREDRAMRTVDSPALAGCIDEATGRLLELIDKQSGRHLLMWRPVLLAQGSMHEAGGFGPFGPLFEAARWRFRKAAQSFSMTADLARGGTWRQRFTFDGPCLRIDAELAGPADRPLVDGLAVSLVVQPGYGGDWPRMGTACLNNQQKVIVADRRGRRQEAYPLTIENVTRGFGDAAWLAVVDRPSGQGVWAQLPPGAVALFTSKAFDFTWRTPVVLAAGGRMRWTFRIAAFRGLDNPEAFADGHLAGSSGPRLAAAAEDGGFRPVTVRLFGQKPVPAALQGPRWTPTHVVSGEYGELLARLRQLRDAAGADRRRAAVLGAYLHRAAHLEPREPTAHLAALRKLVAEAEAVAAAPCAYRSYYGPADLANVRKLAESFDAAAEASRLRRRLAEPFVIDQPRLRHYDASKNPNGQAGLVAQAAPLAAVTNDRELARLAARRLVETFANAWRRFGIVLHETIHHGVLLSNLAPAYSLLADLGAFDADPEGEAAVVAMLADLAEQIHLLRRDKQSVSNWQGMEQAGITAVLAVLPGHPDFAERVEYAVGQFENLLTKGVFTDGMFWEMSMGYHQNVQQFLMTNAENLLRCGADLFAGKRLSQNLAVGPRSSEAAAGVAEEGGDSMERIADRRERSQTPPQPTEVRPGFETASRLADRSMLELARHTADMLMPNGQVPRFEDSSYSLNAGLLAHYARRFRDSHLMAAAAFAGYRPSAADLRWPAEPIEADAGFRLPRCRILPAAGRAILRDGGAAGIGGGASEKVSDTFSPKREKVSDTAPPPIPAARGEAAAALALDFGPHGQWHGDWDKMGFELFDATGPLVCDPGTYRYEEALHWDHFKHTASHSTVTLDDRRQLACCGQLVAHDCLADRHTVAAEARTYPAVTHRRTIRHVDGGFGIEDHLAGELAAAEAVFRLTFPAEPQLEGHTLTAGRLRVELIGVAETDRIEIVPIPIMPVGTKTIHDEPCATGHQLRWRRPLSAGQREVRFACRLLPGV